MITYWICWSGFLTMCNVITAFTSPWFIITKYMPAPLWANPHKHCIYAHPLTVHVHFKLQINCKYIFEMPQSTQWRSSCTVHVISHWPLDTCWLMVCLHAVRTGLSAPSVQITQLCICLPLSATVASVFTQGHLNHCQVCSPLEEPEVFCLWSSFTSAHLQHTHKHT